MSDPKLIPIVCPYCGVGCRFFAAVADGRAVGMEYMPDHPVSNGRLCAKGNAALSVLNHRDRLQHPLKKINGRWLQISWEEALDTVAEKLQSAVHSHSANSLGFLASAKCTNEENYLFQKLARLLGTNNVDHCARLCHSPTVVGLARAFGSGAMTNPLSDLALSECIFIIGSNLAENHAPALQWIWQAKDKGAKIIVVDPRLTATAWLADEFLQLKPGSDLALLSGIARQIIAEGMANRDFIRQRTRGYEALQASLEEFTLQKTAALTGVSAEQIVRAARAYARAGSASIVYCMGITQHTVGSENVGACANLALLTGNVGRPGAGVLPLRGQNNVQGACDMGALPGVLPGYAAVSDDLARSRFGKFWGVQNLPAESGLTVVEMMQAAENGRLKVMWIMGENPMSSDPNTQQVQKALTSLDFLVVQDIFMTDTARLADLVLPAAAWAEKSGSFTNTERRVQWTDRVVRPPADARPDLWIINEVGRRVGFKLDDDAAVVLSEINQTVAEYGGICRERATARQGVFWPCPSKGHPGVPILHTEQFATASGKGQFRPVAYHTPAENVSDVYPMVLTTGRLALHYNSGSMTCRTDSLIDRVSKPQVEMHPVDAKRWDIGAGEPVQVFTARGCLTVEVRITDSIEPGVVFLPFHFPGVNQLTIDALDKDAKIPAFKVAACRVEKGDRV